MDVLFLRNFSVDSEGNHLPIPPRLVPQGGALPIVTNVGCGMRWTRLASSRVLRADERCSCVRRSRVVLTSRRWRQALRDCLQGEGGKKARSPGSTKETVKPLRRECRCEAGEPVVLPRAFFARNHGCIGHPAFPASSLEGRAAPLLFWGGR